MAGFLGKESVSNQVLSDLVFLHNGIRHSINHLNNQIQEYESLLHSSENDICKLIKEDLERPKDKRTIKDKYGNIIDHWEKIEEIELSYYHHDCKFSPVGICTYINYDHDHCIFCHEPSERK